MVWVIAFGELFFGDLWCVVWGYGGMRTHFSLLNPIMNLPCRQTLQRQFDVQASHRVRWQITRTSTQKSHQSSNNRSFGRNRRLVYQTH